MAPKHFDDLTHWDPTKAPPGEPAGGWYPPGEDWYIGHGDTTYWDGVLDRARQAYGDPNIHYNTGSDRAERRLVFDDGTPLPADGTVVYHVPAAPGGAAHNWIQNGDGTVSLLGADGKAGPGIVPSGWRQIGEKFGPVDDRGTQVGPQLDGLPPSPHGYHSDNGVWTPKNAAGDYYTLDPATGTPTYHAHDGHDIGRDEFDNPRRPGASLSTDPQQSGATADAVTALHDKLTDRHSRLSDAEEQLADALLTAHASTEAGRTALGGIQNKLIEAVNNPDLAVGTPAGEQAFLRFLRTQMGAIHTILDQGQLADADGARAAAAVAALFGATGEDPAGDTGHRGPGGEPPPGAPAAAEPGPVGPWAPSEALGLGGDPWAPSEDLGFGGDPLAGDPLSALASTLPAALGGLPFGGGASALDPLAGLAGATTPLAGLTSQLGDQGAHHGDPDAEQAERAADDKHRAPDTEDHTGPEETDDTKSSAEGESPQPEPVGTPGEGAAAGGPAASPPPGTAVELPDGSTAQAATPELASALRSYLAGTPLEAAYRQAGIELPPPGTPVTTPIDPSALSAGAIGLFKDHYVVALSPAKALQDGQVVALGPAASGPDFLGWMDPSARGTPAAVTAAPAPVDEVPAPTG